MARPPLASTEDIDAALGGLPGWVRVAKELRCHYVLPRFVDAVAFTNRIAEVAEQLQHHPEWTVAYRRVDLTLTTHDAGGLTNLDLQLANRIVELAAELSAQVSSGS
jgi:4a-hydroxytetrahydrobiopterin dehydratase